MTGSPAARETPAPPGLRLLSLLGEGGTAEVWLAREDATGGRVAVKILRPGLSEADRDRLRAAGQALLSVRHPALVRTLAGGEIDGRPYLVLEHVEGETLRDRVRRDGPLSEAEAREVGSRVAQGLRALARRGIVHGDVEPGNVLLGPDGLARVCDLDPAPGGSGAFGTPAFMAPEQFRDGEVGAAADMYSLGLTLYFAVTGELPFQVADTAAVLRRHLDTPLPDPRERRAGLTDRFVALLRRMAAKDPGDRPASWDEVVAKLERRRGPARVAGGVRGWIRGPVRLTAVGLLLVALLVVSVRIATRDRQVPRPIDPALEAEARGALAELERQYGEETEEIRVAYRAFLDLADRYAGTDASQRARVRALALGDRLERRRESRLREASDRANAHLEASEYDRALSALEEARPELADTRWEAMLDAAAERVVGLAEDRKKELEQAVAERIERGDAEGALKILEEAPRDRVGGLGSWVELRMADVRLLIDR